MEYLKLLRDKWKGITKKVADSQARFILTLFYFLFIIPIAMLIRLIGVTKREKLSSFWIEKRFESQNLANGKKQY